MSSKKNLGKPTAKQLKRVLSSAAFNPNEKGPLSIIADSGDIGYYKTRAIELILESKQEEISAVRSMDLLYKAISLLALAIAKEELEYLESNNITQKKST